jgi:hypothetical protein
VDVIESLLPFKTELVELKTSDGVTLRGHYAKAPGAKKIVIIIHGLRRNHLSMLGRWDSVYPHLASIFFLDLRGHGLSSRRALITFGDNEALDVKAAVERFRGEYQSVILWGTSMGAAAALKYAGNGGRPDGLILEAMYHSFDDAIDVRANLWHTPKYPALPIIKFLFRRVMRIDFEGLTMAPILARLKDTPVLVVQSREDEKVPMASFNHLAEALGPKGKAIVFDHGNHDSIYRSNREAYAKAVGEFIGSIK